MSTLDLIDSATAPLEADALVIGIGKGDDGPVLTPGCQRVDEALAGGLRDVLVALGATGARDEVVTLATVGALPGVSVVAAVGLGPAGDGYDAETVRQASGAASRALTGRNRVVSALALVNGPANGPATPELRRAACEGALMGAYQFTVYKSKTPKAAPERVGLLVDDPAGARADAERSATIADAVALCRDLVNAAPNDLPPARFAERAADAAERAGLTVEILDEHALAAGGYGGILGVGMGSARPPRLVRMRYQGAGPRVALVGKGITFDSGGISIKPAAKMDAMKSDMAGAAAVVATAVAAARLNLPVEVIATVPMAENLPGGGAYRPADVLTMYGGKRVEVLNTDAEGRLILADAIVRACEDDPAYLIDTATLTGAQVVALGGRTSGVMGTDAFRDRVVEAGRRSGEAMWAMPLPEELRAVLDSSIADLANVATNGAREGGMLVAGQFLADFVADGVGWAHIDVAGPAFNTGKPWGYTPKGGTGVPVRTMLAVLEDIAANG